MESQPHYSGITCMLSWLWGPPRIFSISCFFALSHILVFLAILAHSGDLSDDWQWWSLSLTSQRHQIMPKHPVLNERPVTTKIQVLVQGATADNPVSTLSCFLTKERYSLLFLSFSFIQKYKLAHMKSSVKRKLPLLLTQWWHACLARGPFWEFLSPASSFKFLSKLSFGSGSWTTQQECPENDKLLQAAHFLPGLLLISF